MIRCPTSPPLFPYTTLFRSRPLINRVAQPIIEGILGNALNNLNGSSAKLQQQLSLKDLVGLDAFAASHPFGVFVAPEDRKSTRLNSSHLGISYAVFCLKKKT